PVPGDQDRSSVITTSQDQTRSLSIEVCDAGEKSVDPVTVVVTPTGNIAPGWKIVGCCQNGARLPVEDGEEFWPTQDVAGRVTKVRGSISDYFAGAADGAVRSFACN